MFDDLLNCDIILKLVRMYLDVLHSSNFLHKKIYGNDLI